MAKLKTMKYPVNTAAVVEDPTPGADKIFFWLDAYDKISLSPLLDIGLNQNQDASSIAGFGQSRVRNDQTGSYMGRMYLMGNITDVQVINNTSESVTANIEPFPFMSMDTARPMRKLRYDTDGTNKVISMWWNEICYSESKYCCSWIPTCS